MDVTAKLLRVFQVDKQLRALHSRLGASEKFLAEQSKELTGLDAKRAQHNAQARQLQATASDHEGEMARLDSRMATIRTQMESAQTNKEYKAFLTEMNTHKVERDRLETAALELMGKVDEAKRQVAEMDGERSEREQVKKVATTERGQRFAEIEGRVNELKAERTVAAAEVPADVLTMFQRLLDLRGDEAMASIEVQDRKRHEFTCGSCMMTVPVESVSALMSSGKLTRCVSCQCILYMDEESSKAMQPPAMKRRESPSPVAGRPARKPP